MNFLRSLTATAERRITFALILFLLALYIPFAGNYGLWDPWETHYGEVARQMLQRHDFVSLWWPGSPQDRNEFWSKPVLTMWLMVLGMVVFRLENTFSDGHIQHAFDGEFAVGWTAEWALRLPFILCGIACVWAVWELTRRLAGRRAAIWSALILATSTQFYYVTRQAMTDMAFVAPIAVALCFGGLAVMLPAEEVEAELPRRRAGRISWPHTPIFYVLAALVLLTVIPQLVVCSVPRWGGGTLVLTVGRHALRAAPIVGMLPWIFCFAVYAWSALGATCKRQIYFHIAFLMCGISTLAKGPAGLALPVLVLFFYLLVRGEVARLLPPPPAIPAHNPALRALYFLGRFVAKSPVEVGLGLLLFIAACVPWYHAMLIKHGMGFWNEFIGDNYVHRAAGRHGDRGTFDYYLLQIGEGMFPWTAFIVTGVISSLGRLRGSGGRTRLRAFALTWALIMFTVMTVVNTKFHHYILPALPALAILGGILLDDLFSAPRVSDALGFLLAGVPVLALGARDLAMFPARMIWFFCYDYVNAPNGGRPWPTEAAYDYSTRIGAWAVVATTASLIYGVVALVRARRDDRVDEETDVDSPSPIAVWLLALVPIGTVIAAQLWQPAFGDHPAPLANAWILVGAATTLFLILLFSRGLRGRTALPTLMNLLVAGVACVWAGWGLDRLLTDVSPHWSQKHVIASYYRLRAQNPASTELTSDEPLIAWQMYWRGENLYSKNAIYSHLVDQKEKTVFLGDHNAEKMQEYFKSHAGRRMFFIVERSRFESLRGLLPDAAKPTLKPVDESNNKVYLAVVQL